MLKILINAYACSPNMGSEPGMAWNWCVHLAKYCQLYIITEGEFKDAIAQALPELPQGENMHFYYNEVTPEVREMCWNQGDWRFYKHYKNWQKTTLEIARKIVAQHNIDILHQLNMIGFREPGFLWEIKNIPFVWGPVGGLKQFPMKYLYGAQLKMKLFNRLKNIINVLQLKFDSRVHKALHRASILVSAIPDSCNAILKHKGLASVIIPETGCFATSYEAPKERFDSPHLHVLWVGKFDFRKQLPLALKALAATNNKKIVLEVFGRGNEAQEVQAKKIATALNIQDQVIWQGAQPNEMVLAAMRKAHLFFFTSVSEDTSTVVLEAISNQLPVLCFDACGFGAVIDDTVGRKIKLTTPGQSVMEFADKMNSFFYDRKLLKELSLNCSKRQAALSWDKKAAQMVQLYQKALS